MSDISVNIERVRENIKRVAEKVSRSSSSVTIVCVTKQIPVELIKEALDAGITTIGESRVEEARAKWGRLRGNIEWHMVGHLQTRKVRDAVHMFSLIHSVDSVRLASEIDKRCQEINKVQDVLIEVNISGEESKYGFSPEGVITGIKEIAEFSNVRIQGLMTMAPEVNDPEPTRPLFRGLKKLSEEIIALDIKGVRMRYLSMGMSQDYTVAIEEGSNMVRIGTAIFGAGCMTAKGAI